MSGVIQSQLNGCEDLGLTVASIYHTSACPGLIRSYTTRSGALANEPFELHLALS